MTADSVTPKAAVGASQPEESGQLISDLVARTRAARFELKHVEDAFGTHLLDGRARSEVEAARARAAALARAHEGAAEGAGLPFACDLFVALAIERPWTKHDAREIAAGLALVMETSAAALIPQLLVGSLRAPQLLELPPAVALEVQLSLLVALGPAVEASIWTSEGSGRADCLLSLGATAQTRRFRQVAACALSGEEPDGGNRGSIVGVPIRRWQHAGAALVARIGDRGVVATPLLDEAAVAMGHVLERELLLRRSAERERSLVSASEKRLSRLGFDLHDGALQHVAALSTDLKLLRRQLEGLAPPTHAAIVDGRFEDLGARVVELDRVLRELAHSLEPASLVRRPLPRVVEAEASAFAERTGIAVRAHVAGDFEGLTASQKIALVRVLQEALTNIREHSNAAHVDIRVVATLRGIELSVKDDGDGFAVTRTLLDAAKRGRLGLVGSSERIRLLGGTFDVRSRPGGPTTVSVGLPRWQPLQAERADPLAL